MLRIAWLICAYGLKLRAMNRKNHVTLGLFVGAAAGIGGYAIHCRRSGEPVKWVELLLHGGSGALMGMLAGALPDILERPVHPHHRGTFHSLSMLAALIFFTGSWFRRTLDKGGDCSPLVLGGVLGYCSHLVSDSLTPMGLPLL